MVTRHDPFWEHGTPTKEAKTGQPATLAPLLRDSALIVAVLVAPVVLLLATYRLVAVRGGKGAAGNVLQMLRWQSFARRYT